MPPSSLASFVSVAVAGLLLGGCLGQLELCAFHDVEGIRGRIEDCTLDLCFRDEDGDGVAAVDSADDSTCVGGLEVGDYGDCDDTDDNNFPGNVEVCDGLDNDCVGGPDFDSEEDETLPGAAPSCSPAQTPRLFLRGGGWIGPSADGAEATAVDARTNSVPVAPGGPLFGELRVRALMSPDDLGRVAGVGVVSWAADPSTGYTSYWDAAPGALLPVPTAADQLDATFPMPAGLMAPLTLPAGATSLQIVLALANRAGAPHLASLTAPTYCCAGPGCGGGPGVAPPCDPVWSPIEFWSDPDLASLNVLDLGSCAAYGSARVQQLAEGLDEDGAPCSMDAPFCLPIYRTLEIGCVLINLALDEGGA